MKTISIALISLASTVCAFAQTNTNNGGGEIPVPDSSSGALLLGMALVASLLMGRKFFKK